MSVYLAARIEKPKYFSITPARRGRGARPTNVIGWDTEAENGKPFSMQFSASGGPEDSLIYTVPDKGHHAALAVFLTYVHFATGARRVEHVVFGWNLQYEWTQLFADYVTMAPEVISSGMFEVLVALEDQSGNAIAHYRLEVMNDRRYAMKVHHLESKQHVTVLDGYAFFKTRLNKAGLALLVGEKVDIGDRVSRFKRADIDDPEFRRYACTDAWLTRRIGEAIIAMHEEYDVRTTLTAPHFAAQVFKRHFLTGEVPLPTPELEQAGLAAYHGGKNGFYLPGPRRLERVHAYDITSAYPEAMRQLPDPVRARWREVPRYEHGRHALWRVDMTFTGCRYPGALTHDDQKLPPGRHVGLWLTGYELDAILERGEAVVHSCTGYVMAGPAGGPLVAFVDRFFAQKARYDSGPLREQAKLFLNSLYGKFFQKVELGTVGYVDWGTGEVRTSDPQQAFDYRAGGLYHPPIAGLITGFVRARIHGLEHKYESVMTSTDGFFGLEVPDPADLGARLGGLTVEPGALSIWRERLYVFDPVAGKPKVALHGFRGDVDALRAIPLAPGEHHYTATTSITLRQARTRVAGNKVRAGQFVERDYALVIEGVA